MTTQVDQVTYTMQDLITNDDPETIQHQLTECSNTLPTLDNQKQDKDQPKLIEHLHSKENLENTLRILPKKIAIYKKKSIEQVLRIQQIEGLNFGSLVPGNICEDDLTITGLTNETILVQVLVICLNQEYEQLDEYVFSTRKISGYDYNDKLIMAIQGKQTIALKIALKVPNVKLKSSLKGTIVVQAQGFENVKIHGQMSIPIIGSLEIPLITCPKMLLSTQHNIPLIFLAIKPGKKIDCKVPFKNGSNSVLPVEAEFINKLTSELPFDLALYPQNLTLQPNAQAVLNIGIKQRGAVYNGSPIDIKQVIVLKVKNSNVHFSYPVQIRVY